MIIGKNKNKVINNIKVAVTNMKFNSRVEVDDPDLSDIEKQNIVNDFICYSTSTKYFINNIFSRILLNVISRIINRKMLINGVENIEDIKGSAIITCNHFNPVDNTLVRRMVNKKIHKRLFVVCQETNFAMNGVLGYLMRHADTIPITNEKNYMNYYFTNIIKDKVNKDSLILIYPEQEMWFNYRKPRPLKRGAYYYAASNNVPIISCFIEIRNKNKLENKYFYKTECVMHILKTIYPDMTKCIRENSKIMMETDYKQKAEAYERVYNKKLTYEFEDNDIAGLNINT